MAKPERRLLVLGAGRHQAGLIRRAEERGIRVVASDYYPDSPGKAFASFPCDTDALDTEANIELARRYEVDGVTTTGTDMAVVTMADVADACRLPCYLSPATARVATNKLLMAAELSSHGALRPRSAEVRPQADAADAAAAVAGMAYPLVVKPADSQGQRGITRVDGPARLPAALAAAAAASRTATAIVEEYVAGLEVTASAWVSRGVPRLLTVTDRVTYNPPPSIGIAIRHIHPSSAARGRLGEIEAAVQAAADAYRMVEGPLYIQMLIDPDRLWVVEAAARIGGGHEASLIPLVTGVHVTDRMIDLALAGRADPVEYDRRAAGTPRHALVNFLVARPGTVHRLSGYEDPPQGFVEGGFYVRPGHTQGAIVDSLGRVGWFLAEASDRTELLRRAAAIRRHLRLEDRLGNDLLFEPEAEHLLGE